MPTVKITRLTILVVAFRGVGGVVLSCLLILGLCLPTHAAEKKPYVLMVVPQLPPLATHKAWAPFVEHLSEKTGLAIELKLHEKIPDFEVDLVAGKPDLAFMNPYHQIMAKKAQGYIAMVRDAAQPLSGIVVVAKDGPIKNVTDLNGRDIVFPAPNAYAASLYIRALLSERLGIKFTPRYVDTHTDVYRHVILGTAAAGGAVNNTLARESDGIRAQLRILYETPPSAPHPISAHPRVPVQHRQAIEAAIIALGADPSHQKMLQAIQMEKPVKVDYVRDYSPLEKLGLEKYIVPNR